jgi:RimJ/RimL family protein N-acetyltransferase
MEKRVVFRAAKTGKQIREVLAIVNSHSNLLSKKTFYQIGDTTYYIGTLEIEGQVKTIGIVGYRPINAFTVETVNTVVLPEYRGKGYGEEMSTRLSDYLLTKYNKVFCTVNTANGPMLTIKKKQGYAVEGMLKSHFGPGEERDIYILSKFRT